MDGEGEENPRHCASEGTAVCQRFVLPGGVDQMPVGPRQEQVGGNWCLPSVLLTVHLSLCLVLRELPSENPENGDTALPC